MLRVDDGWLFDIQVQSRVLNTATVHNILLVVSQRVSF